MKYPASDLTPFLASLPENSHLNLSGSAPISPLVCALTARDSIACSLLSLFFHLPSFVFNGLQPLLPKYRGGGTRRSSNAIGRSLSSVQGGNSISGCLCSQELTNPSSTLVDQHAPRFQILTNPFSRNLFLFTSIQNPGGVASSGTRVTGKRKPQVQTANLSYRGCTLRLSATNAMALITGRRGRRRRILNSTSLRRWGRTWRGIFRLRTPPVWGP